MTHKKPSSTRTHISLRADEFERLVGLYESSKMPMTHIMRAALNFLCAQNDPVSIINDLALTPMAVPGRPRWEKKDDETA